MAPRLKNEQFGRTSRDQLGQYHNERKRKSEARQGN